MYADRVTNSMRRALDTTNARREKQRAYNLEHGIEPEQIVKRIRDLTDDIAAMVHEEQAMVAEGQGPYVTISQMPKNEVEKLISELQKKMKQAAMELQFETAAALRDEIMDLREMLDVRESADQPEWEKIRRASARVK